MPAACVGLPPRGVRGGWGSGRGFGREGLLCVAKRRAGPCLRRAGESRRGLPRVAEICGRKALDSGGEACGAPAIEKRPCTRTATLGNPRRSGGARRGRARPEWSVADLCAARSDDVLKAMVCQSEAQGEGSGRGRGSGFGGVGAPPIPATRPRPGPERAPSPQ